MIALCQDVQCFCYTAQLRVYRLWRYIQNAIVSYRYWKKNWYILNLCEISVAYYNFSVCISIYYIPIIHVHRLTRGILCECHMTLRLVINKRPRSPAFPFVSSIESSLSIKTSPERIRICLWKKCHTLHHINLKTISLIRIY